MLKCRTPDCQRTHDDRRTLNLRNGVVEKFSLRFFLKQKQILILDEVTNLGYSSQMWKTVAIVQGELCLPKCPIPKLAPLFMFRSTLYGWTPKTTWMLHGGGMARTSPSRWTSSFPAACRAGSWTGFGWWGAIRDWSPVMRSRKRWGIFKGSDALWGTSGANDCLILLLWQWRFSWRLLHEDCVA